MKTLLEELAHNEHKLQIKELVLQAMEAGLNYGLDNLSEEDFKTEYERILHKLNFAL